MSDLFCLQQISTSQMSSIPLEQQLIDAIMLNSFSETAALIGMGADVNTLDSEKNTPLHIAAKFSFTDIISLLLENNAKINVENDYFETPLDLAVAEDQIEAVNLLTEAGASATAANIAMARKNKNNLMQQMLINSMARKVRFSSKASTT